MIMDFFYAQLTTFKVLKKSAKNGLFLTLFSQIINSIKIEVEIVVR